uniref:Phospholipase A1 member A n=1 Tax=Electrophorus electricus TaxID=8005 RepID=A0AAY5F233_ELEEL
WLLHYYFFLTKYPVHFLTKSFHSSGDGGKCSEFLRLHPSSPAVQLLWFARESPCGLPFSLPPGLPQHVWDPERPTVVIAPGRRATTGPPRWVRTMAHELWAVGQENVLAVDWLVPADMELTEAAKQIGKKLAQAIQQLLVRDNMLNGTISRITGTDIYQASILLCLFSGANSSVHLDYTDAQYVDVIHTNFNREIPLGHVDFYTGSGSRLPGCPKGLFKREQYLLCSHQRAWKIYISSIQRPCHHLAFPCQSLEHFQRAHCTLCRWPGLSTCPEMGERPPSECSQTHTRSSHSFTHSCYTYSTVTVMHALMLPSLQFSFCPSLPFRI